MSGTLFLARLEAAESLLDDIKYDVFACDDGLLEGWRAWRKAAGYGFGRRNASDG